MAKANNTVRNNKFVCPNCASKLPFSWTFNTTHFSKHTCPACHTVLKPEHVHHFSPFYLAGILLAIIPAQISLRYKDDITQALLVGALFGGIGIVFVCFYLYRVTVFKVASDH